MRKLIPLFALVLLAASSDAATNVSGDIATATWTATGSPYVVQDSIRVPAGDTLTIGPGVDVLFEADVPFIVEGSIHVEGTPTDSVRFLPSGEGWWKGIVVTSSDTGWVIGASVRRARPDSGWGMGALRVQSDTVHFRVSRSSFTWNGDEWGCAGIAARILGGYVSVDSCVASWNTGNGIGLSLNWTGTPVHGSIHACTSSHNGGVGLNISGYGALTQIADCRVLHNGGDGIVGGEYGSSLEIARCVIAGNGGIGVGFSAQWGKCRADHCTIVGNMAPQHGAAYSYYGGVSLTNSICWGNGTDPFNVYRAVVIVSQSPGGVGLLYSCTDYLSAGLTDDEIERYHSAEAGMVFSDPLFTDPENDDYSLQPGSPCINAGNPESAPDPDGTRADMGAIPYDGPVSVATQERPASTTVANFPNPFNPETAIRIALPEAGRVTLIVYSTTGQAVATLAEGTMAAGVHTFNWDGRDDSGHDAASGVYLCRLSTEAGETVRRMTLVR